MPFSTNEKITTSDLQQGGNCPGLSPLCRDTDTDQRLSPVEPIPPIRVEKPSAEHFPPFLRILLLRSQA